MACFIRPSYSPKATARVKEGGAMRQARQSAYADPCESIESPQRAHARPLWAGNSAQQTSQIGTEERRGRGEPQRTHEEGRRAQLNTSTGLRSTRTTARHRVVSGGGTSNVSEPESLRKTHLIRGRPRSASLHTSIPVPRQNILYVRLNFRNGLAFPSHGGLQLRRHRGVRSSRRST